MKHWLVECLARLIIIVFLLYSTGIIMTERNVEMNWELQYLPPLVLIYWAIVIPVLEGIDYNREEGGKDEKPRKRPNTRRNSK